MPIIEVDHVTKEFQLGQLTSLKQAALNTARRLTGRPVEERKPFKALDDISFSVEEGEVLGIIGHNGAGKSTLLKLLANISKPTRGSVRVHGKVAPLIEVGAGLVGDLTGRENIYLNGSILGISRAEINRKFDDIVAFAELEEFIDTPVKRYSSGMQVKLGFSIATTVISQVLIVDEVLAVGDLSFQQKCIERMETLIRSEGRTVLIVGHNLRQLQRISTRMLLLDQGRISQDGDPSDVCGIFYTEAQQRNIARHKGGGDGIEPEVDIGYITVKTIKFTNDRGETVVGPALHEAFTITIDFESSRTINEVEIVLGIHTADFIQVLSVSSAAAEIRPNISVGPNTICCRLPDIPLRPAPYSLRLAFADRYRQLIWYSENIVACPVSPGSFDITKLPEVGFISQKAEWTIPLKSHEH
ncbi:MAG: polysaccharide ABC transporter ATP-binding protein [Rhodocyclaceae bacterium]|jgi:ABC-type polysaccharide/polyol phosphate transport system ATPase subunit|nr:polysaccharide ABC transporter ATP-binding protein [Rhodocyclaceae bacterium]